MFFSVINILAPPALNFHREVSLKSALKNY